LLSTDINNHPMSFKIMFSRWAGLCLEMPAIVRYGNLPLQKLNTASTSIITVRPCRGGFVPEGANNRVVWKPSPTAIRCESVCRGGFVPEHACNRAVWKPSPTAIRCESVCRGGFVPEHACNRAVWKPSPTDILTIIYLWNPHGNQPAYLDMITLRPDIILSQSAHITKIIFSVK